MEILILILHKVTQTEGNFGIENRTAGDYLSEQKTVTLNGRLH